MKDYPNSAILHSWPSSVGSQVVETAAHHNCKFTKNPTCKLNGTSQLLLYSTARVVKCSFHDSQGVRMPATWNIPVLHVPGCTMAKLPSPRPPRRTRRFSWPWATLPLDISILNANSGSTQQIVFHQLAALCSPTNPYVYSTTEYQTSISAGDQTWSKKGKLSANSSKFCYEAQQNYSKNKSCSRWSHLATALVEQEAHLAQVLPVRSETLDVSRATICDILVFTPYQKDHSESCWLWRLWNRWIKWHFRVYHDSNRLAVYHSSILSTEWLVPVSSGNILPAFPR